MDRPNPLAPFPKYGKGECSLHNFWLPFPYLGKGPGDR